jgi:hypothetical protein
LGVGKINGEVLLAKAHSRPRLKPFNAGKLAREHVEVEVLEVLVLLWLVVVGLV